MGNKLNLLGFSESLISSLRDLLTTVKYAKDAKVIALLDAKHHQK